MNKVRFLLKDNFYQKKNQKTKKPKLFDLIAYIFLR